MRSHRRVHDASAVGRQDHQDEQHAACGGGNYEEIGHQLYDVIGQERAPRLGGRWLAATDVRRDRDLRDADAELQQFAVNPRRPQRGSRPPWCESACAPHVRWLAGRGDDGFSTARRGGIRDGAR